jgi:acyl carrier protein
VIPERLHALGDQMTNDQLPMTNATAAITNHESEVETIIAVLVGYVLSQHPSNFTASTLPRNQSLLELGVIDSAAVIELIMFVESNWGIEISDDEITTERMGSLTKLAVLVQEHLAVRAERLRS